MKRYSGQEAVCKKCGGTDILTQFRLPGSAVGEAYRDHEAMLRHCRGCGHHWDEAPLDAEKAEADDEGGR